MNYDKTDASAHDTELDNMHGDVELAPNQIDEVEYLENVVILYKLFLIQIEELHPKFYNSHDMDEVIDDLYHYGGEAETWVSDPEYPDREPS